MSQFDPSKPQIVDLTLDDRLSAHLASLVADLDGSTEALRQIAQAFLDCRDRLFELRSANLNGRAARRAFERRVVLQPTDLFRDVARALRAVKRDLVVIEKRIRHVRNPRVAKREVKRSQRSTGVSGTQRRR